MSMLSILICLFAVGFWIFRVAVAFTASVEIEFIFKPLDLQVEIILLFVTFACIILIYKRKLIGALIYLISNLGYYGVYLYNILVKTEEMLKVNSINTLISVVAILLSFIILIDVGMSKSSKKTSNKTKNTDWYYQNDKYDRKYDERVDRNQYKL